MSPWGQLCTKPGLPSHYYSWLGTTIPAAGWKLAFLFPGFGSNSSNLYYSQCFLSQAGNKEITLPLDLFLILLLPLADTVGAGSIPSCLNSQLGNPQAWQYHFPP